jgi:lysozyme family protein
MDPGIRRKDNSMSDDVTEAQRFARCLDAVLRQEGGYVDHPKDPGGATNLGITRKTLARWRGVAPWWKLPKADVMALDKSEAGRIYRSQYWQRVAGPKLPAGLDLALFDFGVNSGPARAVKALQAELKVKADGFVGPVTLGALKGRIAVAGIAGLIVALCDGRLNFLQRLAIFATFGRGWSRRVAESRASALAMAGAAAPQPNERTTDMTFLSGYKTYIVAAAMAIFAIAGLLGVDIPSFEGHAPGSLLMEALAIIFLRQGLKNDIGNA